MFNTLTEECIHWVQPRFEKKFTNKNFDEEMVKYTDLKPFKISENVFETNENFEESTHYLVKLISQYHMECVFRSMKIDMTDANVAGEKGTPYRFIKMYCGADLEDDTELLSGRWTKKPRIASFPNEHKQKFPITKRVDVVSVCSHHTAPFSTMFREDSYAIISYIPEDKILGISKLQRIVDWVARRGHLQEGLTQMIYDEVAEAAETKNIMVRLVNLVHTCESLRGSQSKDGTFTSEYYGGEFENKEVRDSVLQNI
jgi:GTP cyclohydrolase I